jgi:tetratricopeptide (TPR) repeat protein
VVCLLILAFVVPLVAQERPRRIRIAEANSGKALDKRGKLWAVVIGISSYKNVAADAQLKYAHRDAEAFGAFLRSPNGGGFPSTQIKLLLNENATLSSVRTALGTWLPRSAEAEDVVYIFFAGHGVVEGDTDGYLLTHDSDPQNLYATAFAISDLDRIVTERLRARTVVLMADACHSGRIGWVARSAERQVLINRYLDEVGKSGKGVIRVLASRADERSFEDERWGGGHGVFTFFLLKGLNGVADRDKDGVVRVGEITTYLSEVIPEETRALQHPWLAGSIDPQLPLAVVPIEEPSGSEVAISSEKLSLEVRGPAGSEVYLDSVFRGRIRPSGVLVVEAIEPGSHELSIDAPGAAPITQRVALSALRTIVDLRLVLPASAAAKSSPLVQQVKQAIARGAIIDQGGAWSLYQRLIRESPIEPQRADIETDLSLALEEIGQKAINDYVHVPVHELSPDVFHRGAEAFKLLMTLRQPDKQTHARRMFCEGRALIIDNRIKEAVEILEEAASLDPRAAHCYNALGLAYERADKKSKAMDAYKRAAELAPQWILPRFHLGLRYYEQGDEDKAEREFKAAIELDPRYAYVRWMLTRLYREKGRLAEAQKEVVDLIRLAPNHAPAYLELGLIYEASERYREAAAAYDHYLKLAPNSSDSAAVRERAAQCRKRAEKKAPQLRRS